MKGKMLYVVGCLLLIAAVLLSCEDVLNEHATAGDYFPLDEQSRWEYTTKHTYGCRCFDSGLVLQDTVRLHVEEALFIDGVFFRFVDHRGWTDRVIRKVKSQYFESPAYSPEFMFLDPTAPLGFSWIKDDVTQITFEVTAINLTRVINNTIYNHVIEIEETNWIKDDDDEVPRIFATTYYYYAKDVGLIFSKKTYGEAGEQSTIETTLLRYWKE